jgi:hypothetical protein
MARVELNVQAPDFIPPQGALRITVIHLTKKVSI